MEIILFTFCYKKQIQSLLGNAKCFSSLGNRNVEESLNSLVVNDVTTSVLYKELITEHGLSSNDILLTKNTDGIPIFKSSNYAIWPFLELPPHLRNKHILLLRLWFGQKPNMNVFLVPFVEECSKLGNQGFLFGSECQ